MPCWKETEAVFMMKTQLMEQSKKAFEAFEIKIQNLEAKLKTNVRAKEKIRNFQKRSRNRKTIKNQNHENKVEDKTSKPERVYKEGFMKFIYSNNCTTKMKLIQVKRERENLYSRTFYSIFAFYFRLLCFFKG